MPKVNRPHVFGRISGICARCRLHETQVFSAHCDALDEPTFMGVADPVTLRLEQENKKLNDFSQGLVAINLSLTDQVSQLREEVTKLQDHNARLHAWSNVQSDTIRMQATDFVFKLNSVIQEKDKYERNIRVFGKTIQRQDKAYGRLKEIKNKAYRKINDLEAELKELHANQTPRSYDQHFKAWSKIVKVLDDVASGWTGGKHKEMSFMDAAVSTIKDLAADAKKFRALQPCHFANRVTEVSNERGVITSVDAEIEGPVRENVFYYFPFGQPK